MISLTIETELLLALRSTPNLNLSGLVNSLLLSYMQMEVINPTSQSNLNTLEIYKLALAQIKANKKEKEKEKMAEKLGKTINTEPDYNQRWDDVIKNQKKKKIFSDEEYKELESELKKKPFTRIKKHSPDNGAD